MHDFDWMENRTVRRPGSTARAREDEMGRRATLLAHLGYSESAALARLRANLEWEYASVGQAAVAKKLDAVVSNAYQRAGVSAQSTPRGNGDAPRKKKVIKRRVLGK